MLNLTAFAIIFLLCHIRFGGWLISCTDRISVCGLGYMCCHGGVVAQGLYSLSGVCGLSVYYLVSGAYAEV